jgi:hypothetical protein
MKVTQAVNKYIDEYYHNNWYLYMEDYNAFIKGRRTIPQEFDCFSADSVIDHGKYSLAVLLRSGEVLKINQKPPSEIRYFDAKILDSGRLGDIEYIIQPYAIPNTYFSTWLDFDKAIRKKGFMINDTVPFNIGWINTNSTYTNLEDIIGKGLFLLDPGSVSKIPAYMKANQ